MPNVKVCKLGKVVECDMHYFIFNKGSACHPCDEGFYCDGKNEFACGDFSDIFASKCQDGIIISCIPGKKIWLNISSKQ